MQKKIFNNLKKIFSFLIIFTIFSSMALTAQAQFLQDEAKEDMTTQTNENFREEAGFQETGSEGLTNMISTVIQLILGFLGVIFLVLIIYAGFKWMIAGGNQEEVTKAKAILKQAIIGLIITLSAYAITWFVFNYLPLGGGGGGGPTGSGSPAN